MTRLLIACAAVVFLIAPATASADAGEYVFGAELAGGYPGTGRVVGTARQGLSDAVSVRLDAGISFDEHRFEGLGTFNFVFAFDVLRWVPELELGVGAAVGEPGLRARFVTGLTVRTFVSLEWSLHFGLRGEYTPEDHWLGLATFGFGWHAL